MGIKKRPSSKKAQDRFDKLEEAFASQHPEISRRNMFGFDGLRTNGKVFASLVGDDIIVKLKQPELGKALGLPGATTFNPMGHNMTEWAQIPFKHNKKWEEYIKASLEYVEKLRTSKKK